MAEGSKKKIVVDQGICIGCGACIQLAGEYFKFNNEGKSEPYKDYDEADAEKIKEAVDGCPVQAISIE